MNKRKFTLIMFAGLVVLSILFATISQSLAAPQPAARLASASGVTCQVYQPDKTTGKDAFIQQERPAENKGADPELRVKTENGKLVRSVLQFDISGLPAGALINSAELSLWVKDVRDGNATIAVRALTKTWSESTVTWSTPWTTAGGNFGAVIDSEVATKGVKDYWATWNVTSAAANWMSNPASNFGLILESPVTSPRSETKFKSSDDATTSQRPKLTICWGPGVTIEPNNASAGNAGATSSYAHIVSVGNLSNEVVLLSAVSDQGWPTRIYADANKDGAKDNNTAISQTPPLGPNASYGIVVEVDVPANAGDGIRDTTTVSAAGKNSGITGSATDITSVGTPAFSEPVVDGLIDDAYFYNPNSTVQDYCSADGQVQASLMTTYDIDDPSYDNIYVVLAMSRAMVDNTYGVNTHPSWAAAGKTHKLSDLDGSDKAQFDLYDGNGNLLYSPLMDYVENGLSTPSGWGSAGITGGEGRANGLNTAYFVGETSEGYNLNTYCPAGLSGCTVAGVNLSVDSPPIDQYYIPTNPIFNNWEFTYLYEFSLDPAAFGAAGFGKVTIPFTHVSPNKAGANELPVTPCTGSIGDRVWQDLNANGVQDAGEPGLNGVQVHLYRDNGDGVFNADSDLPHGAQTTSGNGNYDFTNLGPATYWVRVNEATVPLGFTLTTNNSPLKVVLASGQDYNNADFGYRSTSEIEISKTLANTSPVFVGGEAVFNIRITNTGASTAIGVLPLQDFYDPSVLEYLSSTPQSDDNVNDGVINWADLTQAAPKGLGRNLNPGESFDVQVRFKALAATTSTVQAASDAGAENVTALAAVRIADVPAPILDGKKDDAYTLDPDANNQDYCDANGNVLARLMSTYDLANPDYVWVILEMDLSHVDNTYGANTHPSWAAAGKTHKLSDLDGSDAGQVILRNGNGTVIYNVTADYFETNILGSAGINAAEGSYSVLPNNDLSLVGVETSIGYSLQTYCAGPGSCTTNGVNLLIDSPPVNANYGSTNPAFSDWQFSYLYEFRFAAAPFGASGFKDVSIDYVHVSPNKTGSNVITVTPCTGSIGDRVWNDADGDGIQDAGEAGLNGVQVTLYRDNGDGVFNANSDSPEATKTTSGNGNYTFDGLGPDTYFARVVDGTVPANMVLTTNNSPLKVVLASAQNFQNADFGYKNLGNASIGDRVFYDLNGDGLPDNDGDPGLNDVAVRLYQGACPATGQPVRTLKTSGNGNYDFTQLAAGVYCVDVDETTLPAFVSLTTGNEPLTVNLAQDQDFNTADFGYRAQSDGLTCDLASVAGALDEYGSPVPPVSDEECIEVAPSGHIGDYVWNDVNGNGIQDEGPGFGLADVTLRLYSDDGDGAFEPGSGDTLVRTTTTDADGLYGFDGVSAGAYWVQVDESTLPGYHFVAGPQSGPQPKLVNLATNETNNNVDFGYAGLGAISGVVWLETINVNGVQNPGEPGIPDAEVCLYKDTNNDGVIDPGSMPLSCQLTDAQGAYIFPGNLPGDYLVVQAPIPGLSNTTPTLRDVTLVVIGPSGSAPDNNFGNVAYGSIGDFVFLDSNGNGVHDVGENIGVPGVPVTLVNVGTAEVATTFTDSNGFYLFSGLLAGVYQVSTPVTWPGLARTTPSPMSINLAFAQNYLDADFGYISPTAVQMKDVTAAWVGSSVEVRWSTVSESDLDGFVVWRSTDPHAAFKPVSGVIAAQNSELGADYTWTDTTVSPGMYWYKIEVQPDGEFFGPVSIQPNPGSMTLRMFLPRLQH